MFRRLASCDCSPQLLQHLLPHGGDIKQQRSMHVAQIQWKEIDLRYWMLALISRDIFAHNLYAMVKSPACVFTDEYITFIVTEQKHMLACADIFLQYTCHLSICHIDKTDMTASPCPCPCPLLLILTRHFLSSVTSQSIFGLLTSTHSLPEQNYTCI